MDLRIFVEPQQGASYETQLAVAQTAEELGFDAFFRSDHYLKMGAGLRRAGPDRRLGHPRRHRPRDLHHPPRHARHVGDLPPRRSPRHLGRPGRRDERRPGRARHRRRLVRATSTRAYGIPFPPTGERFERLEDQLAIITGLWETPAGSTFSLRRARTWRWSTPRPCPSRRSEPRPPIIIGGFGPKRTPRLVGRLRRRVQPARSCRSKDVPGMHANIDAACEAIGRDPATVLRSSAVVVCCGEDERPRSPAGRRRSAASRPSCERTAVAGTPEEVVDSARPLRRGRHHPRLPPGARPDRPRPPPPPRRRGPGPRRRPAERAACTRWRSPTCERATACGVPAGVGAGVAEAVVEAAGPALPELDLVGHEAVAAPVRRAGDRRRRTAPRPRPSGARAPRGPRPVGSARTPRRPTGCRVAGLAKYASDSSSATCRTGPTTRTCRSSSSQPKHERALRVRGQLVALAALVVGEEHEPVVDALEQHEPD